MSNVDAELGEITVTRIFEAPRELVFECMTTPEHLTNFWGPPGMSTPLDKITVDLRLGGVFETVMVNDETGEEYPTVAKYTEIVPPEKLAWREEGVAEGMTATTTFTDLGDGRTEVVIVQRNVPPMFAAPEALAGFEASLDRFAAYLATL
jgi:uncharacterized protein YndB with AHSA1/START domain